LNNLRIVGADSIDLVELTMAFEEEFNVEIEDQETENLLTVGDAYQ
jgi:acyl carrier protein